MIIYVDIDNTITITRGQSYKQALPIYCRINKINKLFDKGHKIIYWTARGSGSGINWRPLTTYQLLIWGAKFTDLKMKKPIYDLFIDDKNIESNSFFKQYGL